MEYKNEAHVCEHAILAQDACNLTALAQAFARMTKFILSDVNNTDSVAKHPAVILMLDKMLDLAGRPGMTEYSKAYDYCETKQNEGVTI